jgi:bacteriophage N4 adsorption protein B
VEAFFSEIWPGLLAALAVLLLASGADDLVPVLICLWHRVGHANQTVAEPRPQGSGIPEERRIAIFVPCWKESGVIGSMIRHNIAAITYRNYDFFLGVYPNDKPTMDVVQQLASTFRNVHVAACPHPGPTSKADCLNWIYQRMLLFEAEHSVRFDTVVLHDAEDIIHPEALDVINRERTRYAMVQVPVLPVATPAYEFTHGIYCDEFAEYQTIDMRARQLSQSFIPSNGVGTGFAREILERLARERSNQVFDPASLTEDYEIGVYSYQAGYSQVFVPLRRSAKGLVATREYFPRRVRSAIRQRTRWVTGIALQCWERNGWRGSWLTRYWFWRDRKGLLTNQLSLATNVLFLLGLADWLQSAVQHRPWAFAVANPAVVRLSWMTTILQCARLSLRMIWVTRIFGVPFAIGVPIRMFHGNFINCCASMGALRRYLDSRLHRRPLVWLKTEHAYPTREALLHHRRELSDVLVSSGFVSQQELIEAQRQVNSLRNLADVLLQAGTISHDELCRAMSLQAGVPAGRVDPRRVNPRVLRTLPVHFEKRFSVLPFNIQSGRLYIAGPTVPPSSLFEELKSFTSLQVEFQLVTRENYEELKRLLSPDRQGALPSVAD